jgi:pantoate--beta-alanine ligase
MAVEIIPCEIVRTPQGLALSSRNTYLNPEEKSRALCLSGSLKKATEMVMAGELSSGRIKAEMESILSEADNVEYVAIVNRAFEEIDQVEIGDTIILVSAWVGKPRLIDNVWI